MQEILDALIADSIERPLPQLIRRQAEQPKAPGRALVVVGMRRSGKTWFCYQMIKDLVDQDVPRSQILVLNFEDERLLPFSAPDFQILLDCFYKRTPENKSKTCYFFFDEIQRIEGWQLFIRRLLDSEKVEITLTGSSAKMLSAEIHTSLRGRGLTTEIFPFSFQEYCTAQGILIPTATPSSQEKSYLQKACADFLVHGGFPETLGTTPETRRQILQQYLVSAEKV